MALRPGARAWAVWSVGLAAYILAVLHRTSLGVAGLDAQSRFHIGAGALASFAVLQLLVYAGLQIPVGLLLDRFGSLRLVVTGAVVMALGQVLMATTHHVGGAVTARILVGAGDAMTFISVLRLVPQWFPARRVPVLTQLTGIVGQAGQILSAVPLAALLAGPGWASAFFTAAGSGLFVAIVAVGGAAGHPGPKASIQRCHRHPAPASAPIWASAWRHPGTRLGPVDALHHPVHRHGLRADVGLPVPDRRRGAEPGHREHTADPVRTGRHGRRTVDRGAGAAPPDAPVAGWCSG